VTNVSLAGVRVLVVEDEMMVAMLLEDMLSDIGCTPVGPARTVKSALKLIEQAGFDIAILDLNLSGDETYPIADVLAARAIPFAFASGYVSSGLRQEYRRIPFLQKPFQQRELAQILAAVLSGRPAL
jgi:CheY-like chemotaxis protein